MSDGPSRLKVLFEKCCLKLLTYQKLSTAFLWFRGSKALSFAQRWATEYWLEQQDLRGICDLV